MSYLLLYILTQTNECFGYDYSPESLKVVVAQIFILPHTYKRGPSWLKRAVVKTLPMKTIRNLRAMVEIMHDTSIEILKAKKTALENGGDDAIKELTAGGKDIISVLGKWFGP